MQGFRGLMKKQLNKEAQKKQSTTIMDKNTNINEVPKDISPSKQVFYH